MLQLLHCICRLVQALHGHFESKAIGDILCRRLLADTRSLRHIRVQYTRLVEQHGTVAAVIPAAHTNFNKAKPQTQQPIYRIGILVKAGSQSCRSLCIQKLYVQLAPCLCLKTLWPGPKSTAASANDALHASLQLPLTWQQSRLDLQCRRVLVSGACSRTAAAELHCRCACTYRVGELPAPH